MRRLLWILALALLAGLGWLGERHLPPAWDPRQPLDLAAPTNLVTPWKLRRLASRPEACFAALATAGPPLRRVADQPSEVGCALRDAVVLRGGAALSPAGPVATCRLAVGWLLFERQVMQPAARRHLGSEVAAVRHLGTRACRNVNHAASGRRSQHATANAIDIAGFTLRDGRQVTLLRDWDGPAAQADFLRALRDGACRWFGAVLGPDYNAAHRDHFHFDMGRWSACR
ncbi:extensin-like domain-containing protein [Falsiroseomonas selenitidurans]|uniref:Extensin family protein n=1 Tax=Falsiroseomonas selenitidurans TaxID=2716335 RepID=A0ABX1E6M8_9PROT|nr:extensin family protein [Falsiroseomonas selenitidurans]NKC32840.1 extensin family protein [Falsiroseomonas selenitidurans]